MSKARDLADLGGVTARLDEVGNSDGALSNRNLIINGAMQVVQRGTSFASGNYQYTLDRWTVGGGHTVSQYTDASGKKWLDATSSNATWFSASQKVENGDYLARNNSVTVSFDWEQVTATAVASVRLFNNIDLNEYINIPEPSVSGRKTITFTVGAISLGSGWLGVGVYNAYATAQSGRFRITNVQLEAGDQSTPFEHRSYGDELQKCQRYYEIVGGSDSTSYTFKLSATSEGEGSSSGILPYSVEKRAYPSVSNINLQTYHVALGGWTSSNLVFQEQGRYNARVEKTGDASSRLVRGAIAADAEL